MATADGLRAGEVPSAPSTPGRVSGAWVIKGTRVQADAIVENARAGCTAEEIAGPDIFPSIPLDIVQRVLRFARITPPSNG